MSRRGLCMLGRAARSTAIASERQGHGVGRPSTGNSEKSIVARLDEYIIGQQDVKKTVAIAIRNRYRRKHTPLDVQEEITPKNILMIGGTGLGKTEIARRLSKLADVSFIKVEATKFTEVGYVGRDVESIVKDLVMASHRDCLRIEAERTNLDIEQHVKTSILETFFSDDRGDIIPEFDELYDQGALDAVEVQTNLLDDYLAYILKQNATVAELRHHLHQEEKKKRDISADLKQAAIQRAESGIVFIDEIDKICKNERNRTSDCNDEGVQRDLLPIIEGTTIEVDKFGPVRTNHILFITAGSFHSNKPEDLLAELRGRLPLRVDLALLSKDDLFKILTAPKHNLLEQQKHMFAVEGVDLSFEEEAIHEIAHIAAEMNDTVENLGARRLYTIIEKVLEEYSYSISESKVTRIDINKEYVQERTQGMLAHGDLGKYIM